MELERYPWLRRLLFVLACLQVLAPATAAIADGVSRDKRTPYIHIEAETESGCVVVHGHSCGLCSMAHTPMARPAVAGTNPPARRCENAPEGTLSAQRPVQFSRGKTNRAPPVLPS